MRTGLLPYILGLSTLGMVSLCYGSQTQFMHLVPKKGVRFEVSSVEASASTEEQLQVELTTEKAKALNLGACFEVIDMVDKARELCQLLHWGTLVESKEVFENILALYRQQGFILTRGSGEVATLDEVRLNDVGAAFEPLAQELPDGFQVAFTAFTTSRNLPTHMGAKASIARYQYTVSRDGNVTQSEVNIYLDGPYLNWQTGELSADEAVKELKAYQRREQLLEGIYKICPHFIPTGIHTRADRQ